MNKRNDQNQKTFHVQTLFDFGEEITEEKPKKKKAKVYKYPHEEIITYVKIMTETPIRYVKDYWQHMGNGIIGFQAENKDDANKLFAEIKKLDKIKITDVHVADLTIWTIPVVKF